MRAEVPHRPVGQCRHSFAVLALKQHKPLNWIQRQMGHRTLQMLLKHYWRWIPTDDLSAEEMSSLESARRHRPQIMPTLCPPGPKPAPKRARKTMIQIGKNPIKLAEREGFEPSVPVTQYARLAIWCLRPLGHLSAASMTARGVKYLRAHHRTGNRARRALTESGVQFATAGTFGLIAVGDLYVQKQAARARMLWQRQICL